MMTYDSILLGELWKPAFFLMGLGLSLCSSALGGSGNVAKGKEAITPVHGVIPFWADGSDYVCHRATCPITIDGKLDESDWLRAGKIVLVVAPGKKEPQTATYAKLLYDDKFLYFAAEVEDHDLVGTAKGHDAPWGDDDVTELFVKPETSEPGYWTPGFWEFHAMPQGATRDYFWPRRGLYPETIARMGDSGMKASIIANGTLNNWHDRDEGYTFEMAIPLSAFAKLAPKPKPGDRWKFLVARYDYSAYVEDGVENSASAYLPELDYSLHAYYPYLVFGK